MLVSTADLSASAVTGQRVLLTLGDHLGSTSTVIDRETGELVEAVAYTAYGQSESDVRPDRYKGLREDVRFTGNEDDVEVGLTAFAKRHYAPALGRWASPDPLAVHAPGEADLNLYAYVHGRVYAATDPLGLDISLVLYTTGNVSGDAPFQKAAETRAQEIAGSPSFDADRDHVMLVGIKSKQDFLETVRDANALERRFGKVRELDLFSHAGPDRGPVFHPREAPPLPNHGEQFSSDELKSIRVNWSSDATARFFGCQTGKHFAQEFANAQHVTTYGFETYGYFSRRPDLRDPPREKGPFLSSPPIRGDEPRLYLINAAGSSEPWSYVSQWIRGPIRPHEMVKRVPVK